MTDLDLEAIKVRANAATEGPWGYQFASPTMAGEVWNLRIAGKPGIRMVAQEYQHGSANAEFITHARTDVPALVSEVERLQAVRELFLGKIQGLTTDLATAQLRAVRYKRRLTITDDMVERACQHYYEFLSRPGGIPMSWERLSTVSPEIAENYRRSMRSAIEAALRENNA
ncbi:hypothetical protein M4D50_01130 [Rothia sp. p3-SID1597]|nr:hypothetical protein [Rothia sp. p3-SID1597]